MGILCQTRKFNFLCQIYKFMILSRSTKIIRELYYNTKSFEVFSYFMPGIFMLLHEKKCDEIIWWIEPILGGSNCKISVCFWCVYSGLGQLGRLDLCMWHLIARSVFRAKWILRRKILLDVVVVDKLRFEKLKVICKWNLLMFLVFVFSWITSG